MKQEKPKDIKTETVAFNPTVLPPTDETVQDSFRYGKNIERLRSNQVESSGKYFR